MTLLTRLKGYLRLIRNLFPEEPPQGIAAFHALADAVVRDYNLPDNDSIRFALAAMIMNGQGKSGSVYKSKFQYAIMLKEAAAKQVAGQVFYDIKTAQQEKQKAADAQAQA